MANKNDIVVEKKFTYEGINYSFYGIENEHIFKQIPWYEYDLLQYLKSLNKTGVYVDVGGNIGNHSIFFLNHCASTKLFVFEPEELCYDILEKNLIHNVNKEYVLQKSAVWNKRTKLNLTKFESLNNMGMSKVSENIDGKNMINADSLDNLISFGENIVLIKIDAEGSECKVLEGALNLIKLNNPLLICEAATDTEFKNINNILLPLGYKQPIRRFNATATYVWEINN